jgi:hypothetical protein
VASYFDFTCRSGGSNLNAGTRTGSGEEAASAALTYAGGSWVNSTRVFTVAAGNPVTDGVAVGDWVALNNGTSLLYAGVVSARTSTTITISNALGNIGTNPANGTYELRVGGAWKGPNGTDQFPYNSLAGGTNYNNVGRPRVNLKNNQTYSITAGMTHSLLGFVTQGYTTTFGDRGRFVLDSALKAGGRLNTVHGFSGVARDGLQMSSVLCRLLVADNATAAVE